MIIKCVSNMAPPFFLEISSKDIIPHRCHGGVSQGQIPRKTCWMVKGNCKCKCPSSTINQRGKVGFFSQVVQGSGNSSVAKRYRYGGLEVPPEEFPKWMQGTYAAYTISLVLYL